MTITDNLPYELVAVVMNNIWPTIEGIGKDFMFPITDFKGWKVGGPTPKIDPFPTLYVNVTNIQASEGGYTFDALFWDNGEGMDRVNHVQGAAVVLDLMKIPPTYVKLENGQLAMQIGMKVTQDQIDRINQGFTPFGKEMNHGMIL